MSGSTAEFAGVFDLTTEQYLNTEDTEIIENTEQRRVARFCNRSAAAIDCCLPVYGSDND